MSSKIHSTYSVLLVGEFQELQESYKNALQGSGYHIKQITSDAALGYLKDSDEQFAVALVEASAINLRSNNTLEILKKQAPFTQVIIINTLATSVLSSLEAQRTGAFWILHDLVPVDELLYLIAKGCIVFELSRDISDLRSAVSSLLSLSGVTHKTPAMEKLISRAERIANLDATVLIFGESGTGKTTLASYLHQASPRRNGPFISISCASIPRELIEAELFGHERGAYTGATNSRPGSFELADGGTIFLDEIGELPLDLQPKLLTFLQDRIVKRVGGIKSKKIDVRVICATNRDLNQLVKTREFREDLFYRINVLNLELPPLRERPQDIIPLSETILKNISLKRGTPSCKLSKEASDLLKNHKWPGNIRELENLLERATAFSDSTVLMQKDIDLTYKSNPNVLLNDCEKVSLVGLTLEEVEKLHISQTLNACNGDKSAAAKMLGVSLKTIYNKIS